MNNNNSKDHSYEVKGSTITIFKPCVAIFEAEDSDTSHFIRSSINESDVVERSDASNGKFLSAASDSSESIDHGYFSFTLSLHFNSELLLSVSYSQPPELKANQIDMRSSYRFLIDENKSVGLSRNYILDPREDVTKWQTISYDSFTLPKGIHSFRVSVLKNTGLGNPNIDFISFNVKKIHENDVSKISVPENDFHTPLQYSYLLDELNSIYSYAKGVNELSSPNAIVLDFSSDIKNDTKSDSYSVEYSESKNFENTMIVNDLKTTKVNVYNLKLGQDLYWRVKSIHNYLVHHLKITDKTPRNLFIEGVTNVRDIGGYKSSLVTNGRIRQGLYLRGANLNKITENGKNELLRLGVRTEIDLRDEYMCKGPYVDGIDYYAIPIPSRTEEIRFEQFENEYKQIFNLILNADKSPVYLHCSVGADRTGIVTFILLIVCGVSFDDAARDYLFTNFSTCGARYLESEFQHWWEKLDLFEGESKSEKAKSWLVSKGLTELQVEHIREIFVESYKVKSC